MKLTDGKYEICIREASVALSFEPSMSTMTKIFADAWSLAHQSDVLAHGSQYTTTKTNPEPAVHHLLVTIL